MSAARPALIGRLVAADARNIVRDPLLLFILALPVLVALVLRYLLPGIESLLQARFGFALAPYHPMIMGVFVGMTPGLLGGVYGLILVDEQDARTLSAVRTMPVSLAAWLTARLAPAALVAAAVTAAGYQMAGLTPLPLATIVALSLSAAAVTPVAALAVPAFARNKVAGLVAFRLVNTVLIAPALIYIVPAAWSPLAWPVPAYWPMRALWRASEGESWAAAAALAPAVSAALAALLYRRFLRRAVG